MPHVSLDARKSRQGGLRSLNGSLPANDAGANGPWSAVPVWRGLDSDFLCSPAIPKAPPAPRVKVEIVGRALRISDEDGPTPDDALERDLALTKPLPHSRMLLLFAVLGFIGGIIAAWLLGALR